MFAGHYAMPPTCKSQIPSYHHYHYDFWYRPINREQTFTLKFHLRHYSVCEYQLQPVTANTESIDPYINFKHTASQCSNSLALIHSMNA